MSLEETNVLIEDLKLLRNALAANAQYLQATDLAYAQMNMLPRVRYRSLTTATEDALQRVNGILGDYLLATHLEEPVTSTEDEPEEALDPNPLGNPMPFAKKQLRKSSGGERLGLYDGETPKEFDGAVTMNEESAAE